MILRPANSYSKTLHQNNNKNNLELGQVKWLVPLISALGRLRQKHQSSSPAQATKRKKKNAENSIVGAREMAQQVKALAARPDDLSPSASREKETSLMADLGPPESHPGRQMQCFRLASVV